MNDNKENNKQEWDFIVYDDGSKPKLEKRVLEPLIPKERLEGFFNDYQKMLDSISDDSEFDKSYTSVQWAYGDLIFHLHGKSFENEVKIFKEIDKAVKHLRRLLNDALGNENTESVWTNNE